ncbi:hypothetical protein Tco_1574584, partial [Tanacetum coccineum]
TSTSEIPTALILLAPPTIVAPSTDIIPPIVAPSTNIISPIVAPPGGFDRKEDGWTLPSHRLALRYTSHRLDHLTSGSSLDHSSSDHSLADHSLSGHSTSDQTIYGHTSPVTITADSPTPSRFVSTAC